jgi:hypothetical protein
MPSPADLSGLGSAALLIAAALVWPGLRRLPRPGLALLLGTAAVLALLPTGGLSPAGYVRGVLGDLSVTTTVLLLRAIGRPFFAWGPIDSRSRLALQGLLAGGGLALYPFALGVGAFDPYRLGYATPWFVGLVLLLALGAWVLRLPLVSLCLALAVLAHAFGGHESTNLWDYVLDPLVSIWGLSGLLLRAARPLGRYFTHPRGPAPRSPAI